MDTKLGRGTNPPMHGVSAGEGPALPPRDTIAARAAQLHIRGAERFDTFKRAQPGLEDRHEAVARRVVTQPHAPRRALRIALQLVDEHQQALAPLTPCRRGCTHCCHLRVEMTSLEAEQLGAAIGRRPNLRDRYMPLEPDAYGHDTPCPFLRGGACSIYPHRPFACRKHHTIDADELFCRHDLPDGHGETLLQIPSNAALLAYGAAMEASMRIGDIRDFFPGPDQLKRGTVDRLPRAGELAVGEGLEHVL